MNQAPRWASQEATVRADAYDERWRRRAAAGYSVHGEANFVMRFSPTSVFDAGCGTGRVAIELATRGIDTVGVDLDDAMLAAARRKAPMLTWERDDLVSVDLGRRFDVVALAGNVMIFLAPGTEAAVVTNLARHLAPGGRLVAGFQLGRVLELDDYDRYAAEAGLVLDERWSTWECDPWQVGGQYAVSVHRNPAT